MVHDMPNRVLRPRTPARTPTPSSSQLDRRPGSSRAKSVPASVSRGEQSRVLDCVLLTPRKLLRRSSERDTPDAESSRGRMPSASQPLPSRPSSSRAPKLARLLKSKERPTTSRKRKRVASSSPLRAMSEEIPTYVDVESQDTQLSSPRVSLKAMGLLTPAPSMESTSAEPQDQTQVLQDIVMSQTDTIQVRKVADNAVSDAPVASEAGSASDPKGKGVARPAMSSPDIDLMLNKDPSVPATRSPKRRRLGSTTPPPPEGRSHPPSAKERSPSQENDEQVQSPQNEDPPFTFNSEEQEPIRSLEDLEAAASSLPRHEEQLHTLQESQYPDIPRGRKTSPPPIVVRPPSPADETLTPDAAQVPVEHKTSKEANLGGELLEEQPSPAEHVDEGPSQSPQRAQPPSPHSRELSSPPDAHEVAEPFTSESDDSDIEMEERYPDLTWDFQLIGLPDALAMPWVATELSCDVQDSELARSTMLFLPPGVHFLIDKMKHALQMECAVRKRAEERYAQAVRERAAAEERAEQLEAQLAVLQDEHNMWTSAAADAIATAVEPAIQGPSMLEGAMAAAGRSDAIVLAPRPESQLAGPSTIVELQKSLVTTQGSLPISERARTVLERAAEVRELLDRYVPLVRQ